MANAKFIAKRTKAPSLVFNDLGDLDGFVAALADHADAPALVLQVAQQRALAALRATGVDTPIDVLAFPVSRNGLDVLQDALADLVLRCQRTDALTAEDVDAIRDAAVTVLGWQSHVYVVKGEARHDHLQHLQPKAREGRRKQAAEDRGHRRAEALLLQREADRLRTADPRRLIGDIRDELKRHGATDRLLRDVKIARAAKS